MSTAVYSLWCRSLKCSVDLSWYTSCLCEMLHLSLDARLRAIGMFQGGGTQAVVANRFRAHRNTVEWTRYRDTRKIHNRSRSRRPRVILQGRGVSTRAIDLRNAFRLLALHLEASAILFAISSRAATVCGSIIFALSGPMCRSTPRAAATASSSVVRLVLMLHQLEDS